MLKLHPEIIVFETFVMWLLNDQLSVRKNRLVKIVPHSCFIEIILCLSRNLSFQPIYTHASMPIRQYRRCSIDSLKSNPSIFLFINKTAWKRRKVSEMVVLINFIVLKINSRKFEFASVNAWELWMRQLWWGMSTITCFSALCGQTWIFLRIVHISFMQKTVYDTLFLAYVDLTWGSNLCVLH